MNPMIGERIRATRLAQNRSLADVAEQANISVATLSRIETDKQSVEMNLFLLLASALHVSPSELLGEHNADGSQPDPLARRIASLAPRERLALWRDLASERRTQRGTRRGSEIRHVAQHVEELLAQLDFLREELESVRKRVKKS